MANRLSRNTLALLTSNLGSTLLSFLLSVLIGRALGQDGLGVYAAALAWVSPLSQLAEFGLGTLMTRDLAQQPDAETAYLRETHYIRLLFGGGLALLLILAAPLVTAEPDLITGLRLSAPLIFILPTYSAYTAIFRARQSMWPIPPLNIGMLVIQVALTGLVFLSGGGVLAALLMNTLTSAGQLLAAWAIYRWKFHVSVGEGLRPSPTITTLLRRAWPFALAGALAAIYLRSGTILLEQLATTGEVGYYAAATRFVEAGRAIPNALFGALFPALAALVAQPAALNHTFRRVTLGLTLFSLALGVFFSLFAAPILNLTYGSAFSSAAPVLVLSIWALLPGLLRGGQTLYWYALGREGFTNRVLGVMIVVQLALSLWLLPVYGAVGAAVVTLLTETIGLALLWLPRMKRHD
jgi:O-antigen/teichoic acid export membrane protein